MGRWVRDRQRQSETDKHADRQTRRYRGGLKDEDKQRGKQTSNHDRKSVTDRQDKNCGTEKGRTGQDRTGRDRTGWEGMGRDGTGQGRQAERKRDNLAARQAG